MDLPREPRTRFCAEVGGCDDPDCYLCQVVRVTFPQPRTYKEQKAREEQRRREEAQKKGRKKKTDLL